MPTFKTIPGLADIPELVSLRNSSVNANANVNAIFACMCCIIIAVALPIASTDGFLNFLFLKTVLVYFYGKGMEINR